MTAKDKLERIKPSLDNKWVANILSHMGYKIYHGYKFKLRADENTPSASIRLDGRVKDFGGDFSGDLIELLRVYHEMSFEEAVEYIAICMGGVE